MPWAISTAESGIISRLRVAESKFVSMLQPSKSGYEFEAKYTIFPFVPVMSTQDPSVQLVLFFVALCVSVYFKLVHRNGWFCVGVFSVFRVVGAGCMLGTIANDASNVWAGVFVCESLGMVLIVLLPLEFMSRAVTTNNAVSTVHPRWFWYPQVITWADIGLAIGGFASASKTDSLDPTKYTQASFGLFTGLYLIVVFTFWQFWRVRNTFDRDERLVLRCVGVCLPLLAIRTAYSLIRQITGDRTWNAVKGNPFHYLITV
ncbi:hypothetical protein PG984_012282 [Apiospora sp. TS-2023a]